MKKLIFTVLIILLTTPVLATDVLYRLSSNEVSMVEDTIPLYMYGADQFGILTDPPFTDGMDVTDPSGKYRVFGYAKINDNGTVRNATQVEVDGFKAYAVADNKQRQANIATEYFLNDPRIKRIVIAIVKGIVREDNEQRQWQRDLMDVVAASTSLANFKNRVAAMDTPVDREFSDAKDYIKDQITP